MKPGAIILTGPGFIYIPDTHAWIDERRISQEREFMRFNIFAVESDPFAAARALCDRHVHKMVLETAQILSTVHRLLDGTPHIELTSKGHKKTVYRLPNPLDSAIYQATHRNHPCVVWARTSHSNYEWLMWHGLELGDEYLKRYGKVHKSAKLICDHLQVPPVAIPRGPLTEFHQAMPDQYKDSDPIKAYRNFYIGSKSSFATWTKGTPAPTWYTSGLVSP